VSECSLLTPLRRDGTSQRQRKPEALDPCAAQVDQRSTAELLLYTGELARLLRYYTTANEPMGDWSAFIERDVTTLAARIGAYDADGPQAEFERLRGDAAAATAAQFPATFAQLAALVFRLAKTFEEWRRASVEGLQVRARLDRLIAGVLAGALLTTIRAASRAADLGAAVALPSTAGFGPAWGDLSATPDLALFASGGFADPAERTDALKLIDRAFERFHEAAKRLRAEAPGFLADTLAHYPQHRPHVALFLAFLRLFNQARRDMNGLTAAHLDFYYREVLRLVPRGPVADRVHVIFELARNLPPTLVPGETRLHAGKDATGVPLVYGTDDSLVVTRAMLDPAHGLKTVFVDIAAGDIVRNVHAAADADSDELATVVGDEKRWATFGDATLPYARVGFAVASPMFWLAEGTRTAIVRVYLASSDFLAGRPRTVVERELTHNVTVEATGPKGWTRAAVKATIPAALDHVQYSLTFAAADPPIVGLDAAVHGETFATSLPVLRFVLDSQGLPGELFIEEAGDEGPMTVRPDITDYSDDTPSYDAAALVRYEGRVYQASRDIDRPGFRPVEHPERWNLVEYANPYKYFQRLRIEHLRLEAHVTGMRGVMLESDFGGLNPAKPFMPFGPTPRIDSSLLIGSGEIFQKQLRSLTLHLTWAGLPETSFNAHYSGYTNSAGTAIVSSNAHFRADVAILRNGEWVNRLSNVTLFETADGATGPSAARTFDLSFDTGPELGEFPRAPALPAIRRFEPGLDRGFVRVQLKKSFLHEEFPLALAKFAKGTGTTPPNPPYTPMVSDFTVDYRAEEDLDYATWTREHVEDRVERLFHIGPFGQQEFAPVAPTADTPEVAVSLSPVPSFTVEEENAAGTAEGTLYLGVAHLAPPQNLSLLFQVAEGSEDPALPAQDVRWGYLTANGWKDFARAEILLDTTNELIASGIIQFAVPKSATNTATVMPGGLHWLRATVRRHSAAVPRTIGVLPQAVQASFRDNGNDPRHLEHPLPAGTIAKLIDRQAAIKSVSQPFSSFGGRMAESDASFRVRVAERLRHKRRAVTLFDYERLVLERFPEVYKVRCLTHTSGESEYAPGSVRVVVVPNLRNRNAVDPLRPRLSLSRLEEIRRDLTDMATDFAAIEVVNPEYEEVRARLNVRFRRGFDKGFYTGRLEQDIIRFLSPWLYDEGIDLTFGGRVHRSAILNFIDEREYVDFVADFEMDHIIPATATAAAETRVHVEEAQPTRSSAVIVPAPTHEIGDAIVSCSDEPDTGEAGPAPAPPGPSPLPPGTPRYLGNAHTRELHDLLNLTRYCQIDEIAIDRRFPVRRIEQAQALGYDFCAYCFGRAQSRR
jgi:hypothetical protein